MSSDLMLDVHKRPPVNAGRHGASYYVWSKQLRGLTSKEKDRRNGVDAELQHLSMF
jgi:hypothetical protein